MRFRRSENRSTDTTSYSDALVDLLVARASGDIAKASATAALETVSGIVSRAFAAAEVEASPAVAGALDARCRAMIGRALIRRGETLFVPELADDMTLRLRPASAWTVTGGHRPEGWTYEVHLAGPSLQTSRFYLSHDVLHFMHERDPARPWRGISALGSAALAGRLSAELVTALGDEAAGTRGHLLPVPVDGNDPTVTALKADLGSLRGKTALVEDQRVTAAPDGRAGNATGWKPTRLGADPPDALVELARLATREVYEAHGLSPGLFSDSGTVSREAWRQFLHGTIAPMGDLVAEEIADKTGETVRLTWSELRASDIMSKARAVQSLTGAGATLESAAMATGLEGLAAAPVPEPEPEPEPEPMG